MVTKRSRCASKVATRNIDRTKKDLFLQNVEVETKCKEFKVATYFLGRERKSCDKRNYLVATCYRRRDERHV